MKTAPTLAALSLLIVALPATSQDAEPPPLPTFDRDAIIGQRLAEAKKASQIAADIAVTHLTAQADSGVYRAYARALRTYYEELLDAGFTEDQAWQIVLNHSIALSESLN